MKFFLRIKNWKLFILVVAIPLIGLFTVDVAKISFNKSLTEVLMQIFFVFGVLMFCGWFYSVAINSFLKIPYDASLNLRVFKTFCIISIVYPLCFVGFINFIPDYFELFLLLHIIVSACLIYCIYFTAKSLKAAILQRPVTLADYFVELLLIWFFPLGVWFIQPEINKLFER